MFQLSYIFSEILDLEVDNFVTTNDTNIIKCFKLTFCDGDISTYLFHYKEDICTNK